MFSKLNLALRNNIRWLKKKDQILHDVWSSTNEDHIIKFENFNLWNKAKTKQILKNINLNIKKRGVISIIGSSGSGKSSLIKCINKSIFDTDKYASTGKLIYKNQDICNNDFPNEILRTQIGLVFQKPVVFQMSIKENLTFPLKAHGIREEKYLNQKVEELLKNCFLWEELKDRLHENPVHTLSGGQQQRLCIARALALQPVVLLMDEPTSSLDPQSSSNIEELILKISKNTTVILISHSLSQVRRISDYTLFLKNGEIVEFNKTRVIFTTPTEKSTRDFVSSKY